MPGADSSQFTAFKKHAAAAVKPTSERNSQVVPHVTSAGSLTKFLPSLTLKNVSPRQYVPVRVGVPNAKRIAILNVTVPGPLPTSVSGTFQFSAGVYNPGGDYSAIINALALQYGVRPDQITLTVTPGSINVSYQINGVPSNDPPPDNIATAIATIIANDTTGATNLVFNNNNTTCTFSLSGQTTPPVSGRIDGNGVVLNYTTPGIQTVQVPSGYSTMTVILAGGGSSGVPSLVRPEGDVRSNGISGSPGGLLTFKVPVLSIGGSTFKVNIGAGGIGYIDLPLGRGDFKEVRSTGMDGGSSSVEFRDNVVAIAQGAYPNAVILYGGPRAPSYGRAASNSAYPTIDLVSSGLASNAGQAPDFTWGYHSGDIKPAWARVAKLIFGSSLEREISASNLLEIGYKRCYHPDYGRANGGNGYCTLIFDRTITTISPPRSLNTPNMTFSYQSRGTYTIPVPTYYRTMSVVMIGGGGGGGFRSMLQPENAGSRGGNGYKLTFNVPTALVGKSLTINVGLGGDGALHTQYKYRSGFSGSWDYAEITNVIAGDGGVTSISSPSGLLITAPGGHGARCSMILLRPDLIGSQIKTCPPSIGATPFGITGDRTNNLLASTQQRNGGNATTVFDKTGEFGLEGSCTITFTDLIPYRDPSTPYPASLVFGVSVDSGQPRPNFTYYDQNNNVMTVSSSTLKVYSSDQTFALMLYSDFVNMPRIPPATYILYDGINNLGSNPIQIFETVSRIGVENFGYTYQGNYGPGDEQSATYQIVNCTLSFFDRNGNIITDAAKLGLVTIRIRIPLSGEISRDDKLNINSSGKIFYSGRARQINVASILSISTQYGASMSFTLRSSLNHF